jgi:serine/threonine protein kinase
MSTARLLGDRYELGEELGRGGMSVSYRGRDLRLDRVVVLKVLHADLSHNAPLRMWFRREAWNAAQLNHPAIASVYDTGESGSLTYIVAEFVDGQTLREFVRTTGPMTQQKALEVMADVCAALDFSHRHGTIHRNVGPTNIMISNTGAVQVMDFGIVWTMGYGHSVGRARAVIGKAQYMSPEQARGEALDARSDIYAAGCLLYELLTGEPPFTGDNPVAVAYQHVRVDPTPPSQANPNISPDLDAVVLKALAKNPAYRYQSAEELRADLRRSLTELSSAPGRLTPPLVATARAADRRAAASTGRAPESHLFVSYAREDQNKIRALTRLLHQQGHEAWLDTSRTVAGRDWSTQVIEAIKGARALLLMISEESMRSVSVRKEVLYAESEQIAVIPVLVEPVAALPDWYRFHFDYLHRIDACSRWARQQAVDQIVAALSAS